MTCAQTHHMTPPDRISADHPQARRWAMRLAFALHGLPLDDDARERTCAEWVARVEPLIAEARPDFPPPLRERLLHGVAARALLIMRELDALAMPAAGHA